MTTLVIGGTTGIGARIAEEIPSMWMGEVVYAPSQEELNVASRKSIASWFKYHEGQYFDRVVYCAGVNHLGMLGSLDRINVLESFSVNVIGFISVLDSLVQHQGREVAEGAWIQPCSVLAVVSDSAHTPMRGSIAYASSKAALQHAIRCAARELAPYWRVNGISPSVVDDTPMTNRIDEIVPALRGWSEEDAMRYELSLIPMGRRALKSEVAELAVSILEGPEFLTGAIIPITGGK